MALVVQLDAFPVSDTKCLFLELPAGGSMKRLAYYANGLTTKAAKASGGKKRFSRRTCKRGAIDGVGIWRVK
jgi:hypothetical protein